MTSKIEITMVRPIYSMPNGADKITSLPQVLRVQIFSYLNQYDLQSTILTNRTIKNSTIETAHLSMKNFIQLLIQNISIDTFPIQKGSLKEILQNITSPKFEKTLLLKSFVLKLKSQIIDIIKKLDDETIETIRSYAQPPPFMENIFTLAFLEKQIDKVKTNSDKNVRNMDLTNIGVDLTTAGSIKRAWEIAAMIDDDLCNRWIFRSISIISARAGNLKIAVEAANTIFSERLKTDTFSVISIISLEKGDIDNAIKIAHKIPDKGSKDRTLRAISKTLTLLRNKDRTTQEAKSQKESD